MKPLTCGSWFHLSLEQIEVICMVEKSTDHGKLLSICYVRVYIVCFYIRREDDRLQATGAELGDSIFNMTGENKVFAFIHDTFLYNINSSVSARGHL